MPEVIIITEDTGGDPSGPITPPSYSGIADPPDPIPNNA